MKQRRAKTMQKNENRVVTPVFKKGCISAGIMPFLRKQDATNMKKHEKTTRKNNAKK